MTAPSRNAGTSFQRVTSGGNRSTPAIPATKIRSGRAATNSSTESRGYLPENRAAAFLPPASRTSSSMKVPAPAAMIGAVETTKSAAGISTSRREGCASRARRRSAPASARPRSAAPRRTPRRSIAVKTASRSCGATAKHGIPISSRARTLSRGFPSVVHRTRSGDSATIRSTSGSLTPPIFGRPEAAAGTLQNRVTPTREPSRPRRKTISVRLGARETTRRGGAASRTVTPRSSFNARGNRSAANAGRSIADARRSDDREEPREKTACGGDPDAAQNGSSPGPMPCGKTDGGGDKTARPDGESAPALLPRKASRDLSPPGRSPGFRLPGGPSRAAPLLSAPSRPRSRHPGSGSVADFVTGYSCGAAMDSHHLPLPRRERSDLRDHSAARRPMRQAGTEAVNWSGT